MDLFCFVLRFIVPSLCVSVCVSVRVCACVYIYVCVRCPCVCVCVYLPLYLSVCVDHPRSQGAKVPISYSSNIVVSLNLEIFISGEWAIIITI